MIYLSHKDTNKSQHGGGTMKKKVKIIISLGITCVLMLIGAIWYAVNYNDARLVVPIKFPYVFSIKDLPMLVAVLCTILYVFALIGLIIQTDIANRKRQKVLQRTRKINPKLGFLGFFGFFGFLGFSTYSIDQSIYPFASFVFFGFFGFFYEGKMSNTFMDERYKENSYKAQLIANRVALIIIFFATILLVQGRFLGKLDYTLIALVIIISCAFAIDIFLSEYLLYRYDHETLLDESEE